MDFAHNTSSDISSGDRVDLGDRIARVVREGALQAQVRVGVVPEAQWRRAIRDICDEAHADDIPPERLVKEIKEALRVLCDACHVPHGSARTDFTQRVVTLCIEEYYATARERDG